MIQLNSCQAPTSLLLSIQCEILTLFCKLLGGVNGSWGKKTKVNRSARYQLEVRVQNLVPMRIEGSKELLLDWVGMTKLDNRTCFSNWAEALENYETWKQENLKILCEKELKGVRKRGIHYGVDSPGMQVSTQYYLKLLRTSSFLCNRQESPPNAFSQDINILHHTTTKCDGNAVISLAYYVLA